MPRPTPPRVSPCGRTMRQLTRRLRPATQVRAGGDRQCNPVWSRPSSPWFIAATRPSCTPSTNSRATDFLRAAIASELRYTGRVKRRVMDRQIREVVAAHRPRVTAAYLFGSHARGTARADSDVDVGVLFETSQPRTLCGLPTELQAALEAELAGKVDVIDLQHASADLVHRVLRDGVLLLDRDPSARIRFEVCRRNEYFDLLPHLLRYRKAAS